MSDLVEYSPTSTLKEEIVSILLTTHEIGTMNSK